MEKLSIKNVALLLWATIFFLLGISYFYFVIVNIEGYLAIKPRGIYLITSNIDINELTLNIYLKSTAKLLLGAASILTAIGIIVGNYCGNKSWISILSFSILGLIACTLKGYFLAQWEGDIVIGIILGAEAIRHLRIKTFHVAT